MNRTGWTIGLAAVLTMGATCAARAADGTWIGASTGSSPTFGETWSDSGNWQGGSIPGTIGGTTNPDTVFMNTQGHYTIELNANYNVKNINSTPGGHGHAIATQTGHILSLTDGGQITNTGNGNDKYFAPMRLEGGSGGSYTFSGSFMKVYAPVNGTATTGGDYTLTLAGSGTGNAVETSGSYAGSIGNGAGGGTLSVIKAGSGTWSLVNANTYTGSTTVRTGTLIFANANSFGTGSSAIQLGDGSTGISDNLELRFRNNITLSRNIVVNNSNPSGTATISVRDNLGSPQLSGSLTLNRDIQFVNENSGYLDVTGQITGTGGFTKLGVNRLTLSNANTFQGDAILSSGELRLNNINALQNSTLDAQAGNVTFNVSGAQTYNLGGLKGIDDITLNDDSISVGSNGQTNTFSGALLVGTGGGGLTKVGSGTLYLDGDCTYTGATTVNGGYLGGDGSIDGNLVIGNGGGFAAKVGSVLEVAGSVDLSAASDGLILVGDAPSARTVIMTYTPGGLTGTFATEAWPVDYSVDGEIALRAPPSGTVMILE